MATEPRPAGAAPEVSLVRRLTGAFALQVALLLVMGLLGLVGLVVAAAADARVERLAPVQTANAAALQGLTDAETGVRGYQLTGDSEFLEPYRRGRQAFSTAIERALATSQDLPRLHGLVEEEQRRGQRWLDEYGVPVATGSADTSLTTTAGRLRAKALFDAYRAANAAVNDAVETLQREVTATAETIRTAELVGLALALAVALALGVLASRRTVRALAVPLDVVRRTLRRLAAGDHDARVEELRGTPVELAEVGRAVDRLADEADQLRTAQQEAARLQARAVDVARAMREHLDPAEVTAVAAAAVAQALDADRAWVREFADGVLGPLTAQWHRADLPVLPAALPALPDTLRLASTAWEDAGVLQVDDVAASPLLRRGAEQFLAATGLGSLLSAPVGAGDEVVGVVVVAMTGRPRAWSAGEVRLLQSVASDLGRALVNARLFAAQRALVGQLRELDRQKTDFVSTVSHELRTPLTNIAGYLELLEDGDAGALTPPQARMLGVVARNTDRLTALIDDLLLLSRIEAGGLRIVRAEVDLGAVVTAAVAAVTPAAAVAGVELRAVVEHAGPVVDGDAAALERAVVNVVGNAVKFSPDGGEVTVTVRADGVEAVVEVRDPGIGIPEAEQHDLFDRFFRASNATARAIPGTGLGLTIVRSVVTAHGGRVELESRAGEGTLVRLVLPRRESARDAAAS